MPLGHLCKLIEQDFTEVVQSWLAAQVQAGLRRADLFNDAEGREQLTALLTAFAHGLRATEDENVDALSEAFADMRAALAEVTRARVRRGVTPVDMAALILALKPTLFQRLRKRSEESLDILMGELDLVTRLVDGFALYTTQLCIDERDQHIERQRVEMMELSTPVVELWESVVAVPLIGTLDSTRAKETMENILEAILNKQARVVIVDITGVSTIDTQVAQHLLRTAAAVRLMGADCIISGISPKIAQTVVQLGVDVGAVITRATLRSAMQDALDRVGFRIARVGG